MTITFANEDRLSHDRAVWREEPPEHRPGMGGRQVSVDYGDGLVEQTFFDQAAWSRVVRWRFGWAPST